MEKGKWTKFMAAPTKQLEDLIYRQLPMYSEQCMICEANMNGLQEHWLSQKHFKCIWNKLGSPPEPQRAYSWDAPWVQTFRFPVGNYLFNHVTGEQGPEVEVRSGNAAGAAAAAAPYPSPASGTAAAVPTGPMAKAPAAAAADSRQLRSAGPPVSAGPAIDHDALHFHWQAMASKAAQALGAALKEPATACGVCQTNVEDLGTHILSKGHYHTLLTRVPAVKGMCKDVSEAGGVEAGGKPWIQSFCSGQVKFNHLTLELFSIPERNSNSSDMAGAGAGATAAAPDSPEKQGSDRYDYSNANGGSDYKGEGDYGSYGKHSNRGDYEYNSNQNSDYYSARAAAVSYGA
mmetsp:Transcript_80152/g.166777  ORF Transcript_80152/g.166777 Transcript_80152/m.166777 type:complete len:346 (+) Transcript_80152:1837-2874(+)